FYWKSLDLRRDYAEHLATMAEIKEIYIRELAGAMPQLAKAFRVRLGDGGDVPSSGTLAPEGAIVLLRRFVFAEAAREGYNLWVKFSTNSTGPVSAEASAQGRVAGVLVFVVALVAQVILYQVSQLRHARRAAQKPLPRG